MRAKDLAESQTRVELEEGKNLEVADIVLLAKTMAIGGLIVDPNGTPVAGVEVAIMPLDQQVLLSARHDITTDKDGRFLARGLPKGSYRIVAHLWMPTGEVDKNGLPVKKLVFQGDVRPVEAGKEDVRISLDAATKP